MDNKAAKALKELASIDRLSEEHSLIHDLDPLSKLLVTIFYIVTVVSFDKYDFSGLLVMVLYPVLAYQLAGIPLRTCFYKLRIVLPLVCAVGLFNPFFDTGIRAVVFGISLSGGVISMVTLMMKGIFCLMASFLLIATTRIENICGALRKLHVPKLLTSLLLLTFRYISLLLEEVSIMSEAYHLRAPGQKGIHYKAWGSFLGQLLLRTMDRASAMYESMELRRFSGEFHYAERKFSRKGGLIYFVVCTGLFLLLRFVNMSVLLGSLFV